ncbi:acyl-CoA carboxylase subunit epsilon [Streptomyces griseofuscus]|uniref:Acyl-CoA carboxylase subunit epsilon n=2 Tax=Streptomyces TaxID=1883 RepID=A0A3R8QER3_9ACTN|nr:MULTISPECIES: acyl-CoA carboxylase subunit epsilon [unclassified Streptomyces]MBJ6999578.1 acyl-CoA carboxylase subunit epsilon [Streptomyces sp. CRPSP2-6A1]RRQ88667.1 acyl-CoA carboxylase subunit epsilon [Streptomyces griseofuscus]SCG03327.1 Acyl-CoA carboxylase epsilon subunit [Streptomyces sp. LamerLS-31b]MYQ94981.1 acyl-CoA carboxylase subunit epsilon [Streptomyces sp. SID4946]SCF92781.1 Acyl-CoA carboxylase epsilon subunit [Streptomyces sp. DconLS]
MMSDLRIERGTPTVEELAALTIVLAARLAAVGQPCAPAHRRSLRLAAYQSPLSWRRAT